MSFWINLVVAASVISASSWLSGRSPVFAGFMVAMPLASILVLPMSYLQHGDEQATMLMAQSIFVAVPVSLMFFVPFLLSERLGLSFWQAYGLGCLALPLAYGVHRAVTGLWTAG